MEHESKISQTSIKNGLKNNHNSSKIEVWRAPVQVWRRLGPSWAIQSVFGGILDCLGSVLEASWRGLGGLLGGLWLRKVANMAPTWSPKRSQNREKIEAKIDQNFDGSWGRIFEGFWWIWEGKMEPSWHRNRAQNPCEHRNAILRKSCSHSCGGVNFLDSGVQVGSKNRTKIDQKMKS